MTDMKSCKLKIKEAVIVEGRDDTAAVKRGVDCHTIETHGFGISKSTFEAIEKAYNTIGIIILTDPDFAGEKIRKRLFEKFPKAKNAYVSRLDAVSGKNVGIENAQPQDIVSALKKARASLCDCSCEIDSLTEPYTFQELAEHSLIGDDKSKERRQKLGRILGIGYANGAGFVHKLNGFKIDRREFSEALKKIDAM